MNGELEKPTESIGQPENTRRMNGRATADRASVNLLALLFETWQLLAKHQLSKPRVGLSGVKLS